MQRQNKNYTDKLKKEERQRVLAFVQLAYESDPRVMAHKEKQASEKAAAKDAKEAAEDAKSAAEEAAKAAEKAAGADAKREKEKLRSALKKARKEFKALGEGAWTARASDLDVVAAVLSLDELGTLMATLSMGVSDEATSALDAAVAVAMKQA